MSNKNQQQVSLAGAAHSSTPARKKHRVPVGLIVLLVLVLAIGALVYFSVRDRFTHGPTLSGRELVQYTYTTDSKSDDVSYYMLGILAQDPSDRMEMMSVVCYDRRHKSLSVLQMPVSTALNDEKRFVASVIGDIWGNPMPINWCPTCRCRIPTDELKSGKHTECGTAAEPKTGSAFTNLAQAINRQYGLPVDNYLMIPHDGLVKLVDSVGGVDMKLDAKITVDGVEYDKGTRTLPGAAAVYYVTQYGYQNTPDTDRERMLRQRQLFAALLDRLSHYKVNDLFNTNPAREDVLSIVLVGSTPVRFDNSSFGKARLLGCSDAKAGDVTFGRTMAEFVYEISHIKKEKITCSVLPGTSYKAGTGMVYSVNYDQTLELLNDQMNPCKLTLDKETVKVTQLTKKASAADPVTVTLDTVLVEQGEPPEKQ